MRKLIFGLGILSLLFVVYLLFQARHSQSLETLAPRPEMSGVGNPTATHPDNLIQRIAFGSCNRQDRSQAYWEMIGEQKPDQWIWLGDNIYGDSDDPAVLKQKYDHLLNSPEYQTFIQERSVYGIYDDHDYGVNDGGKEWKLKDTAVALMFDFLDVPSNDPSRRRPGAYQSYLLQDGPASVRIILLDTRYFRDKLTPAPKGSQQRYLSNEAGDILGEAQWRWLDSLLSVNQAKVTLIGSSIQVLAEDHGYEKWANFPTARRKLLDLLNRDYPGEILLMSGDRHIGEFAGGSLLLDDDSATLLVPFTEVTEARRPLFEVTSSGLTHTYEQADEENRFRLGKLVTQRHFGQLTIDWSDVDSPLLLIQLLSIEGGRELDRMAIKNGWRLPNSEAALLSYPFHAMKRTLKACPESPNCVSTQTDQPKKKMAPLSYSGSRADAVAELKSLIGEMSRTKLVEEEDDYLHYTFTTFPIPFVDDVEFILDDDKQEIHFRSASRVGYSDLGVNERRMKKISQRWSERQ
jgi:alkaline phosphatase D